MADPAQNAAITTKALFLFEHTFLNRGITYEILRSVE